jgi:plastocyanin
MANSKRLTLARRVRTLGLGAALAAASLAALLPAQVGAVAGTTWDVQAGALSTAEPFQELTGFYPLNVTVHPEDDVKFTPMGFHTVTFNTLPGGPPVFAYCGAFGGDTLKPAQAAGAPLNSGLIGENFPLCLPVTAKPTFTLHISKEAAGASGTTYWFTCRIHRDMTGSITVLPAGTALPSNNDANKAAAQQAIERDIRLGRRLFNRTSNNVQDNNYAAGVGTTSTLGHGGINVIRFAPGTIEINVGQSVTWINQDINAPHTVTFGEETPPPPGLPLPPGFLPDANRTLSAPGQTANSGVLLSPEFANYVGLGGLFAAFGLPITSTVTITFTAPGTYNYICALHDQIGMVGTVIVSPNETGQIQN